MRNDHRSLALRMIVLAACACLASQAVFANTQQRRIVSQSTRDRIAPQPSDTSTVAENTRQHIRIKSLRTHARLVNGKIIIDSFSGIFAGGMVRSNGPISLADARGASTVNVEFKDVSIKELGRQLGFELPASVSGQISGVAVLRWEGSSTVDIRRTLSGRMNLTLVNGEIAGVEGLNRLAQFSGVRELASLKFGSGRLDLTADRGRLKINSAEATGSVQSVSARGDIDLASGKVAARVALALSRSAAVRSTNNYLHQLAQAEAQSNAYIDLKLPVLISGTLSKPQVAVDYSSLDIGHALALTGAQIQGVNASSTGPARAQQLAPSQSGEPSWLGAFRGILSP